VARQHASVVTGADVMGGPTHAVVHGAFVTSAVMWFGMMAAMMAPTAWPWVRAYHRFCGAPRGAEVVATTQFATGYLCAWFIYAIGAALLQRGLQQAALLDPSGDVVVPHVAAVIFLVAGIYQFAPLKRACLSHCRTPLGYFLTRWIDGPMGAVRMGFHHGVFCVGCCWALMATAFAVGAMNVWWMTALGLVALLEQTTAQGELLRQFLGAAFIVAGMLRLGLLT
jgi:predicted metal-binding membrane protein